MGNFLSTDQVAASDRLAYWSDVVCDTYVALDCDTRVDPCEFKGSIEHHQLASLEFSRVSASAQRVRHTQRQIAKATDDYFFVSIQTKGQGIVRQDNRDAVLCPGDFALHDTTRPYELQFDNSFEQLVLMLPGESLRSQLNGTERMTATKVCGQRGAGSLLIAMINTLQHERANFGTALAATVAGSVVNILVAGLQTLPTASAATQSNLTLLHREQIKAYVRAHLWDPQLSVAQIGQALRMSPSSVHRAFVDQPLSVSKWMWRLRLEKIRAELEDPQHQHRSISDIVFRWGFNDAAHFSRAFKEQFGETAKAFRDSCHDRHLAI